MELIQAPNQCFIASVAMVSSIPLNDLIETIGHDGLEKINDEPEPWCYRGHHPEEIKDALYNYKQHFIMRELYPQMVRKIGDKLHYIDVTMKSIKERIEEFKSLNLKHIVTGYTEKGTGHAVAYDNETKRYFDPAGIISPTHGLKPTHYFFCYPWYYG